MPDQPEPTPAPTPPPISELEGGELREPGCYLHLASGLLTRIYREDLGAGGSRHALREAGRVARLSGDPDTPVTLLRIVASQHRYRVNF